jgi:predicted RNA-binding Zn-ribbon protein involved in translation (DUF1610 family)
LRLKKESYGSLGTLRAGRPRKNRDREILLLAELGFNREQIADATGLKRSSLRRYIYAIRESNDKIADNISKRPRKCSSCGGMEITFDRENGEAVCTKCGLVQYTRDDFENKLPFDTTYALTNHLAFGKSLGGTLPRNDLFTVLARGPLGTKDLPIRSTQIQVMMSAVDPPVVKLMLNYGSGVMKELGLDRDEQVCHVLSDQYGRVVRQVAAIIQTGKVHVQPHLVARAALYHLLISLYPENAENARSTFPFDRRHLKFVQQVVRMMKRVEEKKK